MLGGGAAAMAPLLQHETYEQVYRNGPDIIFAGSEQPAGKAEPVEGGFQVNGRWPFASGCQQADWMFCVCVMTEDGQPLPGPVEGMPKVRGFVLPARQWQIEDTWYAAGLKGTGSHHITLTDTFVPAANFFDLPGQACVSGSLYYAAPHLIPAMHIAVAVGIARGALDDLVALANTGRQQQLAPAPMRDTETFQYELGRTEAEFNAAQAFARDEVARIWRHAIGGTLNDVAIHTQSTQAAIWISAACVRIADACFALGGSSTVYETSSLQRRMRDLHVVVQHKAVQQRHYAGAGALLLSQHGRST
jgi:alkylation response protein AidB-like acyl-CoA dehydrogenase